MPRFAANLTMMFNEVPFLERFAAAAAAGFRAVEFLFPYEYEPAEINDLLARHGLTLVLHNLPAGDWAAGERGIACLPGREAEFRDSVERALRYATALKAPRLNCLAGLAPAGADPAELTQVFVRNLTYAAGEFAKAGVGLLVEAINTIDMPGFFLNTTRQGLALMAAVGSDALKLQYDIYHMQIMEGDLARTIEAHLGAIGHIQIADNPGRHEPGTGEINYPFLFGHLDRIGYGGWISAEYRPLARTADGLAWLTAAQKA